MDEVETVTVRCPDTIDGSFGQPCPGEFTVEYHPRQPPLYRITGGTCGHGLERFFEPMAVWQRAAGILYDRHQEQKRKAQTTTGR